MPVQFVSRTIYDLTFFILIIVIWLNVIFGIIIDTFAILREKKNQQGKPPLRRSPPSRDSSPSPSRHPPPLSSPLPPADSDAKNRCFICNQERTLFEKEGISFEQHTYKEHNVWNYFFYMVYLTQKDPMDYNGTESHIAEKIEKVIAPLAALPWLRAP